MCHCRHMQWVESYNRYKKCRGRSRWHLFFTSILCFTLLQRLMRVINSLCQHFRDFRLVLFLSTKYQQEDKCNEFPSTDITYTFLRVDSDSTGQYSFAMLVFSFASGYCRRIHKPTRVYCPKIPHTNRYCRTIRLCTSMNNCFCFFFWDFTNIFKRLQSTSTRFGKD